METEPTMSLELFEDKNNKRVYAVSKSDFVDVLLSFLTMPIGTIILLIGMIPKIGGMSTLYGSVEGLKVKGLLQTEACKKMLLHPKNASEEHCKKLKVNIDEYPCSRDCYAKSDGLVGTSDNAQRGCVASRKDGVFVTPKRFIISDDLQVSPFVSKEETGRQLKISLSPLPLENEKEVKVGKREVLDLLKHSLLSETPLTDMLKKMGALHPNHFARRPEEKGNGSNSTQVSVKLTVNKSKNKVVYAEGEEEFADLLFSFLAFPLGFVAKFFGGDSGIKCLDNLYRSALKKFIESKECEGLLVDPKLGPYFSCKNTIIGCVCSKDLSGNDELNVKQHSPTFLVTDELNVKLHSPTLGISLLEKLSIPGLM